MTRLALETSALIYLVEGATIFREDARGDVVLHALARLATEDVAACSRSGEATDEG